jgi:hypothetical protein
MADKPTLVKTSEEVTPIAKPDAGGFTLDKFKSKHAAAVANVETLQTGLPHHSIAQAKDFVRLHPNEESHWSPELCFVNVPIKGQKRETLHLIDEDLAMRCFGIATDGAVASICNVMPAANASSAWRSINCSARGVAASASNMGKPCIGKLYSVRLLGELLRWSGVRPARRKVLHPRHLQHSGPLR